MSHTHPWFADAGRDRGRFRDLGEARPALGFRLCGTAAAAAGEVHA